jgi:hypothetical protein
MMNDTIQMKAMVQVSITMVSARRSPIRSDTGTVSWQLKPKSQRKMPETQCR